MVNRWLQCALVATVWTLLPATVNADVLIIPPRPAPPLEQTVNELLSLDAARALENEKQKAAQLGAQLKGTTITSYQEKAPNDGADAKSETTTSSPVQLTAIYGVDGALHADLLINGSSVVFAKGNIRAIRGQAKGWQLKHIATPCVELVDPTGRTLKMCSYRSEDIGEVS